MNFFRIPIILGLLLGVFAAEAKASPYALPYTGRLTEADGSPLAGPIDLQCEFFRSAAGNDAVGPVPVPFKNLSLVEGIFQVTLSLLPDDFAEIFGDGTVDVYIEVTDLTHKRTLPRQRLMAVPYAMRIAIDSKTLRYDDQGLLGVGPVGAPAAGEFLTKNGAGNLVWATPSATSGVTAVTAGTGLTGGGTSGSVTLNVANLNTNLFTTGTIAAARLPSSSSTSDGILSSTDWATFNGKEPALVAGNAAQYLRGDKAWTTLNSTAVPEGTNLYYTDVRAKAAVVADALVDGTTTVAPSQNVVFDALALKQTKSEKGANNGYAGLDGNGKVPVAQMPFSTLTYFGAWNANTNTPTLTTNCVGHAPNNYFIVNTAGATTLNGISSWNLGDWVVCSSSNTWQKIGSSVGGITSVNLKTGAAITLDTGDLAENGNLFYTTGRATTDSRAAMSATAPLGYSSATGVLSLATANGSTTGALSSGDWTTFDAKVGAGSNVGSGGVGAFKQKSGVNLEFRSVNAGSNKISVALDAPNNEIDVDVNEANLTLANFGGTLGVNKGGTGATSSTSNGVLLGNGTSPVSTATVLTNGQLLIGSTGAAPVSASLTQAANQGVTVTGGAGSLALATVQDIRTTASPTFAGLNLSGALSLPTNGLVVGTNQLVAASGKVGIGTATPVASLDINGVMRLAPKSSVSTCDVGHAGSLGMTSLYSLCVCNGTGWVEVQDATTACVWGRATFAYTGGSQTFAVPAGVTSVTVKVWGGGGGGGGGPGAGIPGTAGSGGGGGFTKATITSIPTESLTVLIGGGGSGGAATGVGGAGAGYSGVKRAATILASAGGGAAGGGVRSASGGSGGSGGGGGGGNGVTGGGSNSGVRGTTTTNGTGGTGGGGNGAAGVVETGGDAAVSGSGSTGGFNGGGKGGARSTGGGGGGGGGGAGYFSGGGAGTVDGSNGSGGGGGGGNATGTGISQLAGTASLAGGSTDSDYPAGVGAPGTGGTLAVPGTNGGNGYVIISW